MHSSVVSIQVEIQRRKTFQQYISRGLVGQHLNTSNHKIKRIKLLKSEFARDWLCQESYCNSYLGTEEKKEPPQSELIMHGILNGQQLRLSSFC